MKTAIAVAVTSGLLLVAIWDSPMVRSLRLSRQLRKGRGRDAE